MYFDLKRDFLFSFTEKNILKVYNNYILFTVMSGGIFSSNIYLELCDNH